MFLKTLTISDDIGIIREINFRNGINLIVDETIKVTGEETGNNVGKTTVLMLIDFCLGSSGKHIFTDPENNRDQYALVKDYLINNQVMITLVLKENLSVEDSTEVRLERNFLSRKKLIRKVNGEQKTEEEYERFLTEMLFPGHFGRKPTFRQIIAHNIRYKDLSINNTLRNLDGFTRDDEYETLYLFLLGCDFSGGDDKQSILSKLRVEQSFKARLEQTQTKSAYEQLLDRLSEEIELLNAKKLSLNVNPNFESGLTNLNNVRYEINNISSSITKLKIKSSLIHEAESDLRANKFDIDTKQLHELYAQAQAHVGNVEKTFDELVAFHNQMISAKIRFITQDLPNIESEITKKSERLSRLLENEAKIAESISRHDSFTELEDVITEINNKFLLKGEYESVISQITLTDSNISTLTSSLNKIDDDLFSDEFSETLKNQISKFNRFFSAVSKRLYGEQYALKADPVTNTKGQRLYKFSAFNTNFSSGKKQGEISCFDIAYTLFADEEKIPCLHFLLNDKKELMHDNQLVKIADLVNMLDIQFVASILKDKLPVELNKDEYFVVRLSQSDKLFRIESGKSQGLRQ